MYYVYGLHDPITNELCYVGITNNLEKRKKQHLASGIFADHYYSIVWMHRIEKLKNVAIRVISQFPDKNSAKQLEKETINYLAEIRHPLVNTTHYLKQNRYSNITLKETFEATQWFIDEMEKLA